MIDISQWRASIGHWHHRCKNLSYFIRCGAHFDCLVWLYIMTMVAFFWFIIISLLNLSGDVELNPGPLIDERPIVSLLLQWLDQLVEWKPFAYCLPGGLLSSDILKIEAERKTIDEQKTKLFEKWLDMYPNATWKDVIKTLELKNNNKLAQILKENLEQKFDSKLSQDVVRTQEDIMFDSKRDEKKIMNPLIALEAEFSDLLLEVRKGFREMQKKDAEKITDLTIWLEVKMSWNNVLTNASIDEIFQRIFRHYDFIDCTLIVDMSRKFLQDYTFMSDKKMKLYIVRELEQYKHKADNLCSSTIVKQLNTALQKIYQDYRTNLDDMPQILIKLYNPWQTSNIYGLKILIHHLLPIGLRQSLMKYIDIQPGSVIINFAVYDYTVDCLLEYTRGKLPFMHHIGIFILYINNHPVLEKDEIMNFTFELALLEAVTAGHNEAVEFLLQLQNVDIDCTDEEGMTALMKACRGGHVDIVDSLLSAKANVNLQDKNGLTALMTASQYGHISIIHKLLKANANPHLLKSNGSNALMIASFYGHYNVVDILVSKKVEQQRRDGWNALMFACQKGHLEIVELLLKEQADLNIISKDGLNCFLLACRSGHTQIVSRLLKEHIDISAQGKGGWNAFMLACRNGHTKIVDILLKKGIDPNIQNEDGWTGFMLACENGHTQIVKLLKNLPVSLDTQNKNGWTGLMLACQNDHIQIIRVLLQEPINLEATNNDCMNALMLACKQGLTDIVRLLLKKRINRDAKNKYGWNALMLACENGREKIVKLLLKDVSLNDLNDTNNYGWTALMLACQNGHTKIAKLLLMEKANPNVLSTQGETALILAHANGHIDIVQLLLKWNADQTTGGSTTMTLAKSETFYQSDTADDESVSSDDNADVVGPLFVLST